MLKRVLSFVVFIFVIAFILKDNFNTSSPSKALSAVVPSSSPTPSQIPFPTQKILQNDYQIFQSFNNCGPASLSMTLSYFQIHKTQKELGEELRPYQHPQGDNDDKSVTLDEIAKKATEYDLVSYHRPNGNIELIKQFIAYDIPVLTRTWLTTTEDIGHYRVVKGYSDESQTIIQDDSYQGKNISYSYTDFNTMWEKFNYEYVVLAPENKKAIVEEILGSSRNEKASWEKAVATSQNKLRENPEDIDARFNLSVALFHTGDYKQSVSEFEAIQNNLSSRTLWYQIEPIQAYYELGDYDKVFVITDSILNNYNRAFSELYILRGKIYQKQGNINAAKNEFEKAVFYNKNLEEAKDVLNSI